jgi:hypothetical protein
VFKKEKKNAGVWQPVPPDRPAATNNKMAMAQCCQLLAELSGQSVGKYGRRRKKSGPLLSFFNAIGLKKKFISVYRSREKYTISRFYLELERIRGEKITFRSSASFRLLLYKTI